MEAAPSGTSVEVWGMGTAQLAPSEEEAFCEGMKLRGQRETRAQQLRGHTAKLQVGILRWLQSWSFKPEGVGGRIENTQVEQMGS